MLIGTAGTVDVGAIDDLPALARIAEAERLHFHIDGAFGALAVLAPELAPLLTGIERADSLAFDWHKWGQVPYDSGFLLVRDGELMRQTFAADAAYLRRAERGLAGGDWWPCDYGPDLSRGFRALKTWFTLKTHGADAIGNVIAGTIALAQRLAARVMAERELELLAPVPLNIVCFGYRSADANRLNAEIVADLHEAGRVAPSLTSIGGRTAIRAAIVNHRTAAEDVDALVTSVLAHGRNARVRQRAIRQRATCPAERRAAGSAETEQGEPIMPRPTQPTTQTPGIHHKRIGDVVVTAINDGMFEGSFAMLANFPATEAEALHQAAFRATPPRLAINCYLVQTATRLALVELGLRRSDRPGSRPPRR